MANLDWPAFSDALWLVNDRLGIPPEWQLAVMYLESSLDPSSMNSGGCSGLNQLCPGTYEKYVSVPVNVYRTWSASAQLSGPVFAYWRDALSHGSIDSPARLMLAQLGQARLGSATPPNTVVFSSPSQEYAQNSWLDAAHKGYITMQDLSNVLAQKARAPAVQDALARVYAMRGEQVTPPLTVPKAGLVAVTVGALALVVAAGYGAYKVFAAQAPEPEQIPVSFRRRFP